MKPVSVPVDPLHLKIKISNPVRKKTLSESLEIGDCKEPYFHRSGKASYRFRTSATMPKGQPSLAQFITDNHPLPRGQRPWSSKLTPLTTISAQLSIAFSQIFVKPNYVQLEPLWECYWYYYWMDVWHIMVDAEFTASNGKTAKGKLQIPQSVMLKLSARPDCCKDEKPIWQTIGSPTKPFDPENRLIEKLARGAKDHIERDNVDLDSDFIPTGSGGKIHSVADGGIKPKAAKAPKAEKKARASKGKKDKDKAAKDKKKRKKDGKKKK